jgi:hypothetical protein
MAKDERPVDSQRQEDEYFYKRDQELIEAARRRADAEAQLGALGAATGIADRDLLQDLLRLGYNAQTADLLDLMPLVQVAWSDGSVKGHEREQIFRIARLNWIETGDPKWRRLAQCLANRPADEFFDVTLRGLRAALEAMPVEDRARRQSRLLIHCTAVATASGGLLGLGSSISASEQSAISEILAALDSDDSPMEALK